MHLLQDKKIIVGLLVLVVTVFSFFAFYNKNRVPSDVHFHAGFIVVKNNKLEDFSATKYMLIRPCTQNKEKEESEKNTQIEKAHLHNNVGDVVHIEQEEAKWSDLFINLKYTINYSESIAYLNGKQVENFQNLLIKPYDSLIVFISTKNADKYLSKAVTKKHIIETEKKSEDCGK